MNCWLAICCRGCYTKFLIIKELDCPWFNCMLHLVKGFLAFAIWFLVPFQKEVDAETFCMAVTRCTHSEPAT